MPKNDRIAIIDYGSGNLHSIYFKLSKIAKHVVVTDDAETLKKYTKLVLPGVGYYEHGMRNLKEKGLIPSLNRMVLEEGKLILGICLGVQLFCHHSEEGDVDGLGWIDADVRRFDRKRMHRKLKIPHMGWNTAHTRSKSPLFDGIPEDSQFYFVHSYHITNIDASQEAAVTDYGYEFTSSVFKDNIIGTQFHPEKSHACGMGMLENFVNM